MFGTEAQTELDGLKVVATKSRGRMKIYRLESAVHPRRTETTNPFYFCPTIIELPPGSSCTLACRNPAERIQPMQSDPVYPKPPVVQRSMFREERRPVVLEQRSSSISMS